MKKSILKSQTKSLFRFKNSDTKSQISNGLTARGFAAGSDNTDPTLSTTVTVTLL